MGIMSSEYVSWVSNWNGASWTVTSPRVELCATTLMWTPVWCMCGVIRNIVASCSNVHVPR
jgi:hypothetical protein